MRSVEQIKAAFAAEAGRRQIKVTGSSDLPLSFESLTSEWLTSALCAGHRGAEVTSFELGPVDTGSSNRRKIAVHYNDVGKAAALPTKLFCKATHDLANRIVLGVSGGAYGEATFFKHIRPLLDIEAPVAYFVGYDPDTINSIVMLGDISADVTSFCDHNTEMTRARAESQMALLAKAHGCGYSQPAVRAALSHLVTWPQFFSNTLAFGMKEGSSEGFLAAESVIPPAMFKRFPEVWDKTVASVERHKHLPVTLSHGDVHLKNWYIAGNGQMGLSDWQCVSRGHGSRDVAYAIASALTVENRRAWDKELVRFYLDQLAAAGGPEIGFDEMWRNCRQQLLSALTWWTITLRPTAQLPDMQPRDITLEMIRRIATAADDVGSIDSFG